MSNEYNDWLRDRHIDYEDAIGKLIEVLLRECPQYKEWIKKNFDHVYDVEEL